MTFEEIKAALIKADMVLRPNVIICNPKYADVIKTEFEKDYKIFVTELVEPDKAYLIDRRFIEPYMREEVREK